MEEEILEKKQEMDRLHKEARQSGPIQPSDLTKLEQKLSNSEKLVCKKMVSLRQIDLIVIPISVDKAIQEGEK